MPVMSDDRRRERLQTAMSHLSPQGQITPLPPYQFQVLIAGNKINHVLHAILTVFTCLLWGIVWMILAATETSDRRMMVTVDDYGGVWMDGRLWWAPPSPAQAWVEPPTYP